MIDAWDRGTQGTVAPLEIKNERFRAKTNAIWAKIIHTNLICT